MKDSALHLETYAPAANASVQIYPLDLGVDAPVFSNMWRQGRLTIAWPALPNLTSIADNLTVTIQDSADGITYANTAPLIQVQIPGVATTGAPASSVDCPLPPGLRGAVGLLVAATANASNNTTALITADWKNE